MVDFVFSGSRLKLYIPKETCLITFLIGGIECPRGERPNRDVPNTMIPGSDSFFIKMESLFIFQKISTKVFVL